MLDNSVGQGYIVSMRKLKSFYGTIPPNGWRFIVPVQLNEELAGTTIVAPTLGQLKEAVSKLFINNEYSISDAQFEEVVCALLPEGWCETCGDEGNPWQEERPLDAKKILAFFVTMLRWVRNGKKFVSKEVAQDRFDRCLACPHSTRLKEQDLNCKSCALEHGAREKIFEATKRLGEVEDPGKEDGDLYCKVCGCQLKAKVWFDIQSSCWK